MTIMKEVLDAAVSGAKAVKESVVAEGGDPDLRNLLLAYRGDDLAAQIFPDRWQDRDALLDCARAAAVGFEADVLALVFEAWLALTPLDPSTGERWASKGMQAYADRHRGRTEGVLRDTVSVLVFNRAGDHDGATLPYRLGHHKVIWDDRVVTASKDARSAGYLVREVKAMMQGLTVTHSLARAGAAGAQLGLTPEQATAHLDCAVARMMAGYSPAPPDFPSAVVALAASPGTERWDVIQASMPREKIVMISMAAEDD